MNLQPTYLQSLTIRLAAGLEYVPEPVRDRHARFLLSAQQPDGGFAGRQETSDLYYTSFALRGLAILGELYGDVAKRSATFLISRLEHNESLIDRMSLVFAAALLDAAAGISLWAEIGDAWKSGLVSQLQGLRCADGGFAKGPGGTASSTYHTFLALLCLQLIERPVPDPQNVVRFIMSQESEQGGFREIRVAKRAGTNPTAAAIGVLRMLAAIDHRIADATAGFFGEMQDDEGGLLANSRIPVADLLSTFTGVLTLADLDRIDVIDATAARQFVQSLDHPEGGFLAAVWDETRDVEYTFYGLGSLALLTPNAA
ncbi:MAG: prenyltransferase/squalene oxidase repeat-containing protein [Pirellulaceae bacterium]